MRKYKSKKQLALLTVVFALTLITAFVYAALAGTLTFSGTATFLPAKLDLRFIEVESIADSGNQSSDTSGSYFLSNNDQTMNITVNFGHIEDAWEFFFFVENRGEVDAIFSDDIETFVHEWIDLEGTFGKLNMEQVQVDAGVIMGYEGEVSNVDTDAKFEIHVMLTTYGKANIAEFPSEGITFELKMPYEQVD